MIYKLSSYSSRKIYCQVLTCGSMILSIHCCCTTHSNSPGFVLSSHSNRSWIDDSFFIECVDNKQVVIPLLSRNSLPGSFLWVFDIHCSALAPTTCPTLPLFCFESDKKPGYSSIRGAHLNFKWSR